MPRIDESDDKELEAAQMRSTTRSSRFQAVTRFRERTYRDEDYEKPNLRIEPDGSSNRNQKTKSESESLSESSLS